MNLLEISLKLFLAVALGGLVGLERETSQKPAGFRTNILICIGATMMIILAHLIFQDSTPTGSEVARIAAGVITGIGFIGAGTIIQARGSVLGLTSAATLWAVTGLGLLIGSGYYLVAIICTGFIIFTLVLFRRIEEQFLKKTHHRYQIKTKDSKKTMSNIKKIALHEGLKFRDLTLKTEGENKVIRFSFHQDEEKEQSFRDGLLGIDDALEIKID
jgi:putative Mg2+ transporter-C (MgtC) family protein